MKITIESVDKQIAELEKKYGDKLLMHDIGFDPAAILVKICAAVTIATPIFQFIKVILFFKPKWQDIVQKVIDEASRLCPPVETN